MNVMLIVGEYNILTLNEIIQNVITQSNRRF